MYRDVNGIMTVCDESECIEGSDTGYVQNTEGSADVIAAPTDLPSDKWSNVPYATLDLQYASAERTSSQGPWGAYQTCASPWCMDWKMTIR
mmetsp:Transcript_9767/g.24140  ORF Transcript_9767/g.24140 Transcript_9767/m.24140 type:complete len:91 (+) Transcript_9767:458-730(+)